MSYPLAYPKFRAFSATTNLPLVGGKLYAYLINTTTANPVYSDPELTAEITQPVVLDSNGEATIYGSGLYDLKLTTSADVLVWTADSVAFDQAESTTVNTSLEWVGTITTGIVYLSTTSFSLTGDVTATWHANRRVKIVLTASTLYGTITTAVYTSVTTVVVVLDSGVLSDSITSVSIGILDSSNGSVPRTIPWLALANTFAGANTFQGATVIDDTLNVTGAVDLDSTLNVDGSAVIDSTLALGANITVATTAAITGNTTVGGTLGVTGALTASAALTANALGVNVAAPAAGVIQNSGNIEAGGYVYAPNGFKQPGTGGETLKMIRGIISSAGAVLEGTGYSVVRNSLGNYTVTFSTAFSDTPSFFIEGLTVTTFGITHGIVSASTTQVNYVLEITGVQADKEHHILAIGPK
jgi:hypothetical protein